MNLELLRKASFVKQLYTDYPFPNHGASNELLIDIIKRERSFYSKYIKPGMRVLDAGCGTGNYAAAFATVFPDTQFTGVDFSEQSLKQARRMFGHYHNLTFEYHDLLKPYPKQYHFDVVLSLGVIMILEDQKRGLENLHAALNEDGIIILHLYGKYGLFEKSLIRNIVMKLSYDLDWPKRFEILDRLKNDKRLAYFAKPQSRYWFLPTWFKNAIRRVFWVGKYNEYNNQVRPQRNFEADPFFHPLETYHTIESIFALLQQCGFEFLEFNEIHTGSFSIPHPLFDDPVLQGEYEKLELLDRLVVAENVRRPSNYYFAAKKVQVS